MFYIFLHKYIYFVNTETSMSLINGRGGEKIKLVVCDPYDAIL